MNSPGGKADKKSNPTSRKESVGHNLISLETSFTTSPDTPKFSESAPDGQVLRGGVSPYNEGVVLTLAVPPTPDKSNLVKYAENFRQRIQETRKKSVPFVNTPQDETFAGANNERMKFLVNLKSMTESLQGERRVYEAELVETLGNGSASSTHSGFAEDSACHYARLNEQELLVMKEFIDESQKMSAIIRKQYIRDSASAAWSHLLTSPNGGEFCSTLYEKLCQNLSYIPDYIRNLKDEEQVTKHYINVISKALELYENPHVMIDELPKIAAWHLGFGVSSDAFFVMRNIFMELLPEYMDPKVYEQSKKDWLKFWRLVLDLMVSGTQSEEGERYHAMFEKNNQKVLLATLKTIGEKQEEGKPHVITKMLQNAAKDDPKYEKFVTNFTKFRNAKRMYDSFTDIASKQMMIEEIQLYMNELGARHITYQVPTDMILNIVPYMLDSYRDCLGKGWNPNVEEIMRRFCSYLAHGLTEGMDSGKNKGENRRAPDGSSPFCILFTDVESSTDLWQKNPTVMAEAVKEHHRIIRTIIAQNEAYEVKTAGDSFIIAARDILVGLKVAIAIQLELMRQAPITPGFKMLDNVQGGGDEAAWNPSTLRVRIGIEHCTSATATYDTVHKRYDYYGPSINQCARIETAAAGGQILMSRESFRALKAIKEFHNEPCPALLRSLDESEKEDERGFDKFVAMRDVGELKLKGIKKPVRLASLVPLCLADREFSDFLV
ncbi:Adenylate and Guanylate cyclase catalytic domain containing protein, putative [Angomonas deanei]|uniref:Adenylate and Guanylate cyclase catalytic domain containing protein, putative n=1 Tax=Angomonas deanei TaxID=59799 RepID=A0A7G2CC16_9TRYP|nr:Adenylate and Guanylate cyclase catalytic domain containing protein, putative [Angomonas deanei]